MSASAGYTTGRKPNDLVVTIDGEAARLQLDLEQFTRIDRQGLLIHYSRALGWTTRRLRDYLEG